MSTEQDNFAGMKPVARFVIRPELDPEHQKSWLILGMTTTINQTLKHGGGSGNAMEDYRSCMLGKRQSDPPWHHKRIA